jgi:hypothetical protein
MEMRARGGHIIGISYTPHEIFDEYIHVPSVNEATIIPNIVVAQLLSYYLTIAKKLDPDMPKVTKKKKLKTKPTKKQVKKRPVVKKIRKTNFRKKIKKILKPKPKVKKKILKKKAAKKPKAILERHINNPIIKPSFYPWESKATFNPTAFQSDGKVHIIYRAIGDNDSSVLGYASSYDGLNIEERPTHAIYQRFYETSKIGVAMCL